MAILIKLPKINLLGKIWGFSGGSILVKSTCHTETVSLTLGQEDPWGREQNSPTSLPENPQRQIPGLHLGAHKEWHGLLTDTTGKTEQEMIKAKVLNHLLLTGTDGLAQHSPIRQHLLHCPQSAHVLSWPGLQVALRYWVGKESTMLRSDRCDLTPYGFRRSLGGIALPPALLPSGLYVESLVGCNWYNAELILNWARTPYVSFIIAVMWHERNALKYLLLYYCCVKSL